MNANSSHNRQCLRILEERIARQVADVHGIVTKTDHDMVVRLRKMVGERYDAVNRQWMSLEEENA